MPTLIPPASQAKYFLQEPRKPLDLYLTLGHNNCVMDDKGSIMVVRITDEFNTVWEYHSEDNTEVAKIVYDWLETRDETPIYEITIEI